MKSIAILAVALALGTLAANYAVAAQAKVSPAEARAIVLKARPGVIIDQQLEKPAGSGPRYAFDVKSAGATWKVGVDAITGRVIETAAPG